MPWLNIPHIQQTNDGWCLPACVAMVTAFWEQPLLQDDVALWLGASPVGVPASHIQPLSQRGWQVTYRTGSVQDLRDWLAQNVPCILFVRTGELPYWNVDTPHAVVLAGLDQDSVSLLDPAIETAPVHVPIENLLLAWSYFDYAYAALTPK